MRFVVAKMAYMHAHVCVYIQTVARCRQTIIVLQTALTQYTMNMNVLCQQHFINFVAAVSYVFIILWSWLNICVACKWHVATC